VPIPINRTTLNQLFGLDLKTDEEAADYLPSRAEPVDEIETSEDVVINAVGRELYELFFRGYTRKQWGLDPSELDKSVTARIPTRPTPTTATSPTRSRRCRKDGYTAMFADARPSADRESDRGRLPRRSDAVDARHIIYHRPDRRIFRYRFGKLPYRSLKFDHQTLEQERYQPCGTVNLSSPGLCPTPASASTSI
jgi:UDP-galactopyranose mutase